MLSEKERGGGEKERKREREKGARETYPQMQRGNDMGFEVGIELRQKLATVPLYSVCTSNRMRERERDWER